MKLSELSQLNEENLRRISRWLTILFSAIIFALYVTFFIVGVINYQNSFIENYTYKSEDILNALTSVIIDLVIVIILISMCFLKRTKNNPYSSILICILMCYILESVISYASYNSLMYLFNFFELNTSYYMTISLLIFGIFGTISCFSNVVLNFMVNVNNAMIYDESSTNNKKKIFLSYKSSIISFDKLMFFIPFVLLVIIGLNLIITAFKEYNPSSSLSGSNQILFILSIVLGIVYIASPIAIQFFNFRSNKKEFLIKIINLLVSSMLSIISVVMCFVIGFSSFYMPISYFVILSVFSIIYLLISLQSFIFLHSKIKKGNALKNNFE